MSTPTIHGLRRGQLAWQDDFQATLDNKGKWEATVSFICHLADAVSLRPNKGAPCVESGYTFLGFDSCTVANYSGDLCKVACKYVGAQGTETEFTFDDEVELEYRTELSISTSEEPIETHPRYAELSEADLTKIQHLKAGRFKPTETAGEYVLKTDEKNVKKITFTDERAAELATKINKGITAYLVPNQVWRVIYQSKSNVSASVLNKVGNIAAAKGAPALAGDRSWLFVGCSVAEQGNSFNISLEWRLSGVGGWDVDLYDEEESE